MLYPKIAFYGCLSPKKKDCITSSEYFISVWTPRRKNGFQRPKSRRNFSTNMTFKPRLRDHFRNFAQDVVVEYGSLASFLGQKRWQSMHFQQVWLNLSLDDLQQRRAHDCCLGLYGCSKRSALSFSSRLWKLSHTFSWFPSFSLLALLGHFPRRPDFYFILGMQPPA